jgi:FkbM family methyltransferase
MWMHEAGSRVVVDSPTADYHPSTFRTWVNEHQRRFAYAKDHWCKLYTCSPGDVIVDVGAGKGEDLVFFSNAVGKHGRVIAIEAHPTTFRRLRLFCEFNQLDNVTTIQSAVLDKAAIVELTTEEEWQSSGICPTPDGKPRIAVSALPLDELLNQQNIRHIDFLKMNIEGAEVTALDGMHRTLQITDALCIACHDFRAARGEGEYFRTKAAVEARLTRAGFKIISRLSDPRPFVRDQVNAVRAESGRANNA